MKFLERIAKNVLNIEKQSEQKDKTKSSYQIIEKGIQENRSEEQNQYVDLIVKLGEVTDYMRSYQPEIVQTEFTKPIESIEYVC